MQNTVDTGCMDKQTDRQVGRFLLLIIMMHPLFDMLVKHAPINVGVKNNCGYDSSNLFIIILMNDTLVKPVPIRCEKRLSIWALSSCP